MTTLKFTFSKTALIAWGILTLFSLLQFFLQISANLMTDGMMQDFNLNAGQVGFFSSLFFYTYILAQIPAGSLLSRYSTRWLMAITCGLCGLGCLIFALAENVFLGGLGRMMMGFGAGFGFLGLLYVTRLGFALSLFPLMVGISEFIAMSGTGIGEHVAGWLIPTVGWRTVMLFCASLAICIALASLFFLHEPQKGATTCPTEPQQSLWQQYKNILSFRSVWLSGIYGCGMLAVMTAFSALWGVEFLIKTYHFTFPDATFSVSIIFWGLALGCPLLGWLASHRGNTRCIMFTSAVLVLLLTLLLTFPLGFYPIRFIQLLLFFIGFCSGAYFLCFETASHNLSLSMHGISMAFCSILVMSSAIILQPLMGLAINFPPFSINTLSSFQQAMLVMIIFQIFALFACLGLPRAKVS